MSQPQNLLKMLPKIDKCIDHLVNSKDLSAPQIAIKQVVKKEIQNEREKILLGTTGTISSKSFDEWIDYLAAKIEEYTSPRLKRVINGTGVVVHTNLGRSLLNENVARSLTNSSSFYSNLEYNLKDGSRGSRYSLVEEMICDLTGGEAAIVVNNNAAAVLISLNSLAKGYEVIVSRGQLVEIGGSFRIPDVMEKSGATLLEVGTTNRTHLSDYENGITSETKVLLKVHTSNFRLIGFTSSVESDELADLAKSNGLITIEDLGSGSLVDLSEYGYPKEPTVQESLKNGIDVVSFSGDKLLGGPQAGIIVGRREFIEKIKKNPLNRALRIDKFTLAALETVLRDYYDPATVTEKNLTLKMLTVSGEKLEECARDIAKILHNTLNTYCKVSVAPTTSQVGGGALPECNMDSWAVVLEPFSCKISYFEKELRALQIPIIGRIENDKFLLDVRTIQDNDVEKLVKQLESFFMCGDLIG